MEKHLSKNKRREFLVTDLTNATKRLARKWFGRDINLQIIKIKKSLKDI
jgi:hypothetical protein